jgi:hypothetical protein
MSSNERVITERQGTKVRILIECRDEYHAIKIYDELTRSAEMGTICIHFANKPTKEPPCQP